MKPAIEIKNVSVRYHDMVALESANAQIPAGSICGLVGMNGAGKSTLFNAIMGDVTRMTGSVTLAGHRVKTAQKKGIVAYVPQSEKIDWNFPVSVREVMMMGRYGFMNIFRTEREKDKVAVQKALERVHLTDLADRQIGQLSGGQKKRVFVGRALAQGASILLLDEPFAGVDAKTEASLIDLLQELKRQDVTILIAVHDLSTVSAYCDHMILLNKTIVAAGPTKTVFTQENIAKTYDSVFSKKENVPWSI